MGNIINTNKLQCAFNIIMAGLIMDSESFYDINEKLPMPLLKKTGNAFY
jgi:hypothetical protein